MAREGVAGSTYDRLKELKEFDESKIGCKGLADSGITTIPRIFHHPPETVPKMDRSAESPAASLAEIPVIDLSDLESPTRRRLELLAEGLGLDSKKFKEMGCTDSKALVGTCYPYCPEPEKTMGIAAHSDGQVLTVLMTNQVAGLQVKHGDDWIHVKPCRGGVIINIGDLLQAISNGVYQSVEHRVFANYSRELRISVVMFFNLQNWREGDMMGPLPELLSQDSPAIYRDFTKQEYLDKFLSNGHDSKSLLDFIRI